MPKNEFIKKNKNKKLFCMSWPFMHLDPVSCILQSNVCTVYTSHIASWFYKQFFMTGD